MLILQDTYNTAAAARILLNIDEKWLSFLAVWICPNKW